MPIIANHALARLRAGQTAIGFGVSHLRTVATAQMARTAGYDWLFIDMEHGAFSVHEVAQLSDEHWIHLYWPEPGSPSEQALNLLRIAPEASP